MIAAPIGFVPVQGAEIGDDHVWWFHRTFRERAPGGFGKARRAGRRTRGRELRGDQHGESNAKTLDDAEPYILAVVLMGLGEAATVAAAAFMAVMLREWHDMPPTRSTLDAKANEDGNWYRWPLIEKRERRLRDKLYAEEKHRGLAGHIAWLLGQASVREELMQHKERLIAAARPSVIPPTP